MVRYIIGPAEYELTRPPEVAARGRTSGGFLDWEQPFERVVYPTRSSDGKTIYECYQLPDGRWYCPCADFKHRGHERPCKHLVYQVFPKLGIVA